MYINAVKICTGPCSQTHPEGGPGPGRFRGPAAFEGDPIFLTLRDRDRPCDGARNDRAGHAASEPERSHL